MPTESAPLLGTTNYREIAEEVESTALGMQFLTRHAPIDGSIPKGVKNPFAPAPLLPPFFLIDSA